MKTITTNARTQTKASLLHLFEFEIRDFDGVLVNTLRLTDHDIFVNYAGNDYIPLSITFDKLTEDISQQSNSISVSIDNVNGELSSQAFQYEWRNNAASITRVIFTPPPETPIDNITYNYGYGDNLESIDDAIYPELKLDTITKDVYTLFEGFIDTFSATESSLQATIATKFLYWQNPFPSRTFDQKEFSGIIDAMTTELHWGRE